MNECSLDLSMFGANPVDRPLDQGKGPPVLYGACMVPVWCPGGAHSSMTPHDTEGRFCMSLLGDQ
jgi:hypothetical protein